MRRKQESKAPKYKTARCAYANTFASTSKHTRTTDQDNANVNTNIQLCMYPPHFNNNIIIISKSKIIKKALSRYVVSRFSTLSWHAIGTQTRVKPVQELIYESYSKIKWVEILQDLKHFDVLLDLKMSDQKLHNTIDHRSMLPPAVSSWNYKNPFKIRLELISKTLRNTQRDWNVWT